MKLMLFGIGLIMGLGLGYFLTMNYFAGPKINPKSIDTQVIDRSNTERESGNWGEMDKYTYDKAATYGTENMFTAYVELLPGQSVHPPHRHTEEEFLYITHGSGFWTVDGKELKARSGDLLYASPWKWHGLQNTGMDTMTFFFLKWNNKGIAAPPEPEGAHIQ